MVAVNGKPSLQITNPSSSSRWILFHYVFELSCQTWLRLLFCYWALIGYSLRCPQDCFLYKANWLTMWAGMFPESPLLATLRQTLKNKSYCLYEFRYIGVINMCRNQHRCRLVYGRLHVCMDDCRPYTNTRLTMSKRCQFGKGIGLYEAHDLRIGRHIPLEVGDWWKFERIRRNWRISFLSVSDEMHMRIRSWNFKSVQLMYQSKTLDTARQGIILFYFCDNVSCIMCMCVSVV